LLQILAFQLLLLGALLTAVAISLHWHLVLKVFV
jgi:hypothetical protein